MPTSSIEIALPDDDSYPIVRRQTCQRVVAEPQPVSRLISTVAPEHHADRLQQDSAVQPGRPVTYVVGIEFHAPVVVGIVAARNLPQPGQAGRHLGVQREGWSVLGDLLAYDRAWPYHAHIPAQHVPQLRQLIQAVLAQEPADARDTRVVAQLVREPPLARQLRVAIEVFLKRAVAGYPHG